jgi:hypothetical protein
MTTPFTANVTSKANTFPHPAAPMQTLCLAPDAARIPFTARADYRDRA